MTSPLTIEQRLDLIEASGVVGWRLVYDGCHKIYILTDHDHEPELAKAGFVEADIHPASEIRKLWAKSCDLKFVRMWDLEVGDLPWHIAQFEEVDEDIRRPEVGDIAHHPTLDSRKVVRVEEIDGELMVGLSIGDAVAWPRPARNYTFTASKETS